MKLIDFAWGGLYVFIVYVVFFIVLKVSFHVAEEAGFFLFGLPIGVLLSAGVVVYIVDWRGEARKR